MLRIPSLKRQVVFLATFAALATPCLQAGVKFAGATGYEIVKDSTAVELDADVIENTSRDNATGTLMLKLWAMDHTYKGGTLEGTLLGSYKLDGLAPGRRYTAIRKIVSLALPRVRQDYRICLTLSEYRNGAYGIVDYRNMPNPKVLGPLKTFDLEGPWKWQTSYEGGTIDISVAKISHHRTGKTGSLKLSAWATREPYHGGRLQGFELGTVSKPALEPGYNYKDVHNVAKFTPPPDGSYYVCLALLEFGRDGQYEVVDHISSSKLSTFRSPVR